MATTTQTFTGDGVQTSYSIAFSYRTTADVKATIDAVANTAFSVVGSTVTFSTAPANGSTIVLFRETSNDTIEADFQSGSALRAVDLNDNFTQLLFVTQESTNTSNTALTNSNTAISTSNTAAADATTAVNTANAATATAVAAQQAIASAVTYDPVVDVSQIPTTPSDGDYIEIQNSTGIENFSPLTGTPTGFVGDSGLVVRLQYNVNTWTWVNYFASDSEDRYFKIGAAQIVDGDVNANAAIAGTKISPNFGSQNVVAASFSGDGSSLTNVPYPITSVNTQTGAVVLTADDIDDSTTTHKFATSAQLGLADSSVQPGDNLSSLTNDVNFITTGANVSVLNNDANYITAAQAPITSVNTQTGVVNLTASDVGALPTAGGTMTGALTLSGAPTALLHAATKQYVDDNAILVADGGNFDSGSSLVTSSSTFDGGSFD